MSETRERSGIFKFLYIVLSIITFPIFAIIYILKHPKWILFFIVLLGGVVVYFPLKEGVNISNIVEWYKKKYDNTRLEIVSKAIDSGNKKFIPQNLLDEAKKVQEELELKKIDDTKVKGENFNDKIVRDGEFEEIAIKINKKGGFKKKGEEEQKQKADLLVEEGQKAGGLFELMQKQEKEVEIKQDAEAENQELNEVEENTSISDEVVIAPEGDKPNDIQEQKDSEDELELNLF